jgi:pyruvate dehydrogenase E1 component
VQLLGSGTIFREVLAAADLLSSDFGVAADVWSVPSFTELRREGLDVERWNRLHPTEEPKRSYVETMLRGPSGTGDRIDGLHQGICRSDPAVH